MAGNKFNNIMDMPLTMLTTGAFPLDARSYFSSLTDAENAAAGAVDAGTEGTYYFGQTLVVVENGKATSYIIQPDKTLSPIFGGESLEVGKDVEAISAYTQALGRASLAGVKGYSITAIDKVNKKITVDLAGTSKVAYKENDLLTLCWDYVFPNCSKIISISANQITVDFIPTSLPDTTKKQDNEAFFKNKVLFSLSSATALKSGAIDVVEAAYAEGYETRSAGWAAHAEGYGTTAIGTAAHSEGINTTASFASHAEGRNGEAIGKYCHAEGRDTIAGKFEGADVAHAEGNNSKALAECSHAEGYASWALGLYSHASGIRTITTGMGAYSEGIGNIDTNYTDITTSSTGNELYTKWENLYNLADTHSNISSNRLVAVAEGIGSHIEGVGNYAKGLAAHAEGKLCLASGNYSHAGGYKCQAKSEASFAHGYKCKSATSYSTAMGHTCEVNQSYCTAIGSNLTVHSSAPQTQVVIGLLNEYNTDTSNDALFVIGNGSWTKRANLLEVTKNKGIIYKGDQVATVRNFTVIIPNGINSNWKTKTNVPGSYIEIDVSGMRETDSPIVDIIPTNITSLDDYNNQLEAYATIGNIETADNKIIVYCYEGKPDTSFKIQLKAV